MGKLFVALEEVENTELMTEISGMTDDEVDVLSNEVIESSGEIVEDANAAMEELDNAFDYCDRLIKVAERIEGNQKVSTEDIAEIQSYAKVVSEHYGVSMESVCPKLREDMAYTEALESVGENISNIVNATKNVLLNVGATLFDNLTYAFKVIGHNRLRQKKLSAAISRIGNQSATIDLGKPSANFFVEDGRLVSDLKEYVSEYERMSNVMSDFNKLSANFISGDLLSGLKTIWSMLTLNGKEKIQELFDTVEGFKQQLMKIDKFQDDPVSSNRIDVIANRPMLGGFVISINSSKTNRDKGFQATWGTGVRAYRKLDFDKVRNAGAANKLIFEGADSKSMQKLLQLSEKCSDSIYAHKSFQGVLSQIGNMGAFSGILKALPQVAVLSLISRSYRAYASTQVTLFASVARGVGYTLRQQKQAFAVVDKFVKAAE